MDKEIAQRPNLLHCTELLTELYKAVRPTEDFDEETTLGIEEVVDSGVHKIIEAKRLIDDHFMVRQNDIGEFVESCF